MRSLIALSAALFATTVLTGAASAATDGPRFKPGYAAKADRLLVARAAADDEEADAGSRGKGKADRGEGDEDDAPRGKGKTERVENDDEDDAPRGKRRVERLDDDEARELRYRWWKHRMERRALEAPPAHWRWEYRRHLQMRALSRQPVGPYWAHRPYGRPYFQ